MNPHRPAQFLSRGGTGFGENMRETWLYAPAFRKYLFLLFGPSAGASHDRMLFSSVKRWSLAQRVVSVPQTFNLVIETEVFDIGPCGQHQLEHCNGVV